MEPRRNAQAASRRWEQFRNAGGVGSVLLAAAMLAAVLVMDAWPLEPLPYRSGQYIARDIYARVNFEVESPTKTAQQRDQAAKMTPAMIRLDEQSLSRMIQRIGNLPGTLKSTTRPGDLDKDLREDFLLKGSRDVQRFARFAEPAEAQAYNKQIDDLAERLKRQFIVTPEDFSLAHGRQARKVRVVGGPIAGLHDKSLLVSLSFRDLNKSLGDAVQPINPTIRDNILHYLHKAISGGQPIYRFDATATDADEKAARKSVKTAVESIPAGTLLVQRSGDSGLKDADLSLLWAEHEAFGRQRSTERLWWPVALLLGRAGMIGGVVVLLCLYISKYKPRIVKNHWRGFAIVALMLLVLLLSKVTIGTGRMNPYLSVFGIFVASAMLAIAYDQRFAFAVAGALVVLTALQLRLGIGGLLVLWSATAAVVFLLREVRTRSKLIETGGIVAVVVFVAVWVAETANDVPGRFMLVDSCLAATAAVAGGFITLGILPLIERIFSVATSLTLLEWCDANKPLLKRLALEAPGTYNHSLVLGAMCESAAEAVGARGLLARVGAYYHDVGKINKPDYFSENQAGSASRHERLSPAMSLLVIKGHVKDGLEMARKYGLPRVLREFIATHHGTTLVEYFYHAAAQQRASNGESAPDEVEFRYPGPKPRLKEAAILMLADAAESSLRATSEPTVGQIETQVHFVISKRLMDGQLDECELTLKEVHTIETSLVKSFCGMYHVRVKYPSQEKPKTNGEEEPPNGAKPKKE